MDRSLDLALLGCGYVGCALARRLREPRPGDPATGTRIGTTTREERLAELRALGLLAVRLRLADTERLARTLAPLDAVVLSVAPGRAHPDPRAVYVDGASHLVEALEGSSVRRLVYTSSVGVYGQDDGGWVDEDTPPAPTTERGGWLLEAERRLLAGGERLGISTTVLRLAGIYGPDRGPARWIRSLAGAERADGESWLNLVHVDDIVEAIVRLLGREHHGVLNLTDDEPLRRREFYDPLLREAGLEPVRWVDGPSRGRRVSNRRLKAELPLSLAHPRWEGTQ